MGTSSIHGTARVLIFEEDNLLKDLVLVSPLYLDRIKERTRPLDFKREKSNVKVLDKEKSDVEKNKEEKKKDETVPNGIEEKDEEPSKKKTDKSVRISGLFILMFNWGLRKYMYNEFADINQWFYCYKLDTCDSKIQIDGLFILMFNRGVKEVHVQEICWHQSMILLLWIRYTCDSKISDWYQKYSCNVVMSILFQRVKLICKLNCSDILSAIMS